MLHFRTKAEKDFSVSGHFVLGFSHAENVFSTRDCCRCDAGSARDGNTTSGTKSGAHESSWGLLLGLPGGHCMLLLGFWPAGMPVRGRGCRTGLVWLAVELGSGTRTHARELEAEALPGCPWGYFVEMSC